MIFIGEATNKVETVSEGSALGYNVGDIWGFRYSYTSDTVDGTFTLTQGNLTLDPPPVQAGQANYTEPMLQVQNGQVVAVTAQWGTKRVTNNSFEVDELVFGSTQVAAPRQREAAAG